MAKACYDPRGALRMWKKMEEEGRRKRDQIPGFLSTHPTHRNRVADIEDWLPEAAQKRNDSDCGPTVGFASQFRAAFGGDDWARPQVGEEDLW